MLRIRSKGLLCGLVLSMIVFLWGCGNQSNLSEGESTVIEGGAGEDAVTMEYWTFVELHGQHFEKKMLTKWNAEYPERQIKLNVTVMPYDDMHNKLSIAVQTGTGCRISRISSLASFRISWQARRSSCR